MKTLRILLSMAVGSASVVYATTAAPSESTGFLTYCFVGFFAMIVVFQLMPAMVLFAGMVKGLFSRPEKSSTK